MSKKKLFCFPYAGGSASVYLKWKRHLSPNIELHPVELPGRGRRLAEPLLTSMNDIIDDLYNNIKKDLDNDYMFFGHSMGTAMIYELMVRIHKDNKNKPLYIFLSGRNPPHFKSTHHICDLPDKDFIEEIKDVGGTPAGFFENKELLEVFLPILKADYKAIENYEISQHDCKWDVNLAVFNGILDEYTSDEDLRKWGDYTTAQCELFNYEGGHFFINDKYLEIIDIINKKCLSV